MPDDRLNRIESKIDKLSDHLGSIDATLAAQHVSLVEHMRRSDALERQMEPIKKHVSMAHGALKMISLMGIGAAIVEGLISLLEYLKK